jgi:hypothetical protein
MIDPISIQADNKKVKKEYGKVAVSEFWHDDDSKVYSKKSKKLGIFSLLNAKGEDGSALKGFARFQNS